jgi:CspA family cold shock protein
MEEAGMLTGTIKRFYGDRGFGFIRPDDGSDDVFFHVSFTGGVTLAERDRVEFEMGIDPKTGRERAQAVRLI